MKVKVKSKKTFLIIFVMAIILGVLFGTFLINQNKAVADKNVLDSQKQKLEVEKLKTTENNIDRLNEKIEEIENKDSSSAISVVSTMNDKISGNATYCPTFQLVWNDMTDVLLGGKKVELLDGTLEMVDNLNKKEFTKKDISDEYYYTKYGKKLISVRDEIKNAIKERFDEESKVLDNITWADDSQVNPDACDEYVFYAMLKRVFNFEYPFDVLEEGTFEEYKNVKYFGIKKSSDSILNKQVSVLFYDDVKNLAVKLSTKTGDEVVLVKTTKDVTNFNDVYDIVNKESKKYKDNEFAYDETLKIPNLNFDVRKEYSELEGKTFLNKEGKDTTIGAAIQTIEFELDNEGGKVLSEAIMTTLNGLVIEEETPRYFDFTEDFYLFVKEENKNKPYLAVKVDDISAYQDGLEK